jgi:hypothetical protein
MKIILILTIFYSVNIFAEREIPGLNNSRLSLDLSSRTSYNEREKETSFQHFIGLDIYKVFNYQGRDIGNLVFQPFLHRIDNGVRTPGYYDDNHDWEFIWRTVAFTFTGLGNNAPWLKVGHFEVPFGIESTKNTFGDLHQYGQNRKLGLKMDWGLSIGQELSAWQYEFSLTRGSGLKYRDNQDPYAFSGRIATLNDDFWATGLSFYHGEILKDKLTQKREMFAWDIEAYYETWGVILELNTGQVDTENTLGGLVEVNWSSRDENFLVYTQYHLQDIDNQPQYSAISCGVSYRLTSALEISGQTTFELNQVKSNMRSNLFEFQIRYTF